MPASATAGNLRAAIAGGRLTLSGERADSAELAFLLPGAFGSDTLSVVDPLISVSGEALTLRGRVALFGLAQIGLTLELDDAGPRLALTLTGDGLHALAPGLSLGVEALCFAKERDGPWSTSGSLVVQVEEARCVLTAAYAEDGGTRRFRLRSRPGEPLALSLAPIGALVCAGIELRRLREGEQVRWQFVGDGRLTLAAVPGFALELAGTVTFPPDGADAGIAFEAAADDARNRIALHLPVPGLTPPPAVSFTPRRGVLARHDAGWTLRAAAETRFSGLPAFLTEPLPGTGGRLSILPAAPRDWTLAVEPGRVALGIDRLWDAPALVELPTLDADGAQPRPLGRLWIDVVDAGLVLGDAPALTLTIRLAPSAAFNRVFGVRADGSTPRFEGFRTWDADTAPEQAATGIVLAVSGEGVLARLTASPIHCLTYEDPWWIVTLGDAATGACFGKLRLRTPEFRYTGGAFSARGAYEVLEPLALPLAPVRAALAAAGLGALAEALPAVLPIEPIELVDAHGYLRADGFLARVAKAGAPAALRTRLEALVAALDAFLEGTPGEFNRFLAFAPPRRLDYRIDIAPGGVRLDIATGPDDDPAREPIRLLLPAFDPVFGPELMGIELYGLAFGALLNGAVGVLRVDAQLDRFDLASFLLCELAGGRLLDGRPAREFRRRYHFGRVLALLPSAAPVPVPLFYDAIGIDYRGWDGLEFRTHWSFPEPAVGLLEAFELVRAGYRFASRRDYLFDPRQPAPGGLDLPFALGPHVIRLPRHLGGSVLGDPLGRRGQAWPSVANALDGLKTGEPHYFLDALPLPVRVGTSSTTLGPFAFEVAWALATPREFAGAEGEAVRAALRGHLGREPDPTLVELVPHATGSAAGLVLVLQGGFAAAGLFALEGGFALAAGGGAAQGADGEPLPQGVATGVRFAGQAGALALRIEGALGADTGGVWIATRGELLSLGDQPLLRAQGQLAITADGLRARTELAFGARCTLGGELCLDRDALQLGGELVWAYAARATLTGHAVARFDTGGVSAACAGRLYGAEVDLSVRLGVAGAVGHVSVFLPEGPQAHFREQLLRLAEAVERDIRAAFDGWQAELGEYSVELSLRGLRQSLPTLCRAIVTAIDKGIADAVRHLPWYVPRAPVLQRVRAQAAPHRAALLRLAAASDPARSDDEAFRGALRSALDEVLAHRHLTVRVAVLGTVVDRELYDDALRARLLAARAAVERLPATAMRTVSAEAVYQQALRAAGTLPGIGADLRTGIEANYPVVRSVAFETPLGTLPPALDDVDVRVLHHGAEWRLRARIDLDDLPGTAVRIAERFAALLRGD